MIEVGQIYRSARPKFGGLNDGHVRIKVVSTIGGAFCGSVGIVTVTASGRELRPRSIQSSQLHASALNQNECIRSTGYILERQ